MEYKEYNEKDLQSFEYETTIQSDGKIIGVCELGKATIQMINDSNNYSIFKDSWIKTIHGSFYIHDVSPVQEKVNIKLECYDIKYKLDTKYDKTKYIFPLTLKDWRNSIFEDCGLSYDNSDFPNSSLILNEQPYLEEGCSNRDVIKMIAEAGCSTVISDNEDVIYFEWFDDITEPYEVIDWLELTTEREMSNPINTVVLGRGDTEDNVYYPNPKPTIPNEFRIDNNYILDPQEVDSDEDRRYDVIQNIYDRVNSFSYLIFNMRSQSINSKLSIRLGQKIKYKDIWNNDLIAYVMTKKITWLGGSLEQDDNYEITLSAEELKESSTNFSYSSNIKNDILRVERKADKNSGKIEDIIEQNSKFATKMTTIDQTLDTISQTVSDIENLEREVSNKNYLYIENAMMGQLEYLEINGVFSLNCTDDESCSEDIYLIIDKTMNLSSDAKKIQLPISSLENDDRFIIENGKTRIEKSDGTIENYEDIDIELFDGENYLYLESFQDNNINFYAKYIIKNDYTEKLVSKLEMNNLIKQTNERTDIELSKKVGNNEVIAKINMSTEKDSDGSFIGINADKLDLKGKEFNLTSDDINIVSNNLSIDKEGILTCKKGIMNDVVIENGQINLTGDSNAQFINIYSTDKTKKSEMSYWEYRIDYNGDDLVFLYGKGSGPNGDNNISGHLELYGPSSDIVLFNAFPSEDTITSTIMLNGENGYISCYSLSQKSLVNLKKNFEKLNNAIEIIKNADVYKYNFNFENDTDKKHIGLIIGEGYNTPEEVISKDGNSIDTYSLIGLCLKAIQEQQEEIEKLKGMIQ